ncbi:MAG: DMT family transporter [Proteobacteria bacterium]|nr:DMT family transporter [Pseudomonadota bacterium]
MAKAWEEDIAGSCVVCSCDTHPTGAAIRLPELQSTIPSNMRHAMMVMLLAMACYAFQDASVKMLPSHIHVVEILFFRGLFALPLLLVLAKREKHARPWATQQPWLHGGRALLSVMATLLFMASFRLMSLTDAYALTFCAPLLVGVLGAFWLKEPLRGGRLFALLGGVVGVFFVCAPDLQDPLLLAIPLVGGACHAVAQVSLRRLTREDSTTLVMACFVGMSLLVSAPFVVASQNVYDPETLFLFVVIGALGGAAQVAMTLAFRWGSVTLLAPLEYVSLLWGLGLDGLLWHKAPTLFELFGVSLILGGCSWAAYNGMKAQAKLS